ncbi:MAG: hypothetical protein AB1486_03730 [Planctomycetota bacterium]
MDMKLKDGVPSARQACRTDFVIHVSVTFDDLKWNGRTGADLFQRAQSMPASEAKVWKEAFEVLLKKEKGRVPAGQVQGRGRGKEEVEVKGRLTRVCTSRFASRPAGGALVIRAPECRGE